MKTTKKSLLTLSVLMAGLFQTSFKVQETFTLAEVQADKEQYRSMHESKNYRKLATHASHHATVVQNINVRITNITVIRNVIRADRELLAKLSQQSQEIKGLVKQHKNDQSKISELKDKTQYLNAQIAMVKEKLSLNIQKLEEENIELTNELESTKSKNNELSEELTQRKEEFTEVLNSANSEIEESQRIITTLNEDVESLKSQLAQKEDEFKKLHEENCKKQQKISELQEEINQSLKDKEEIMTALAELEEELERIEGEESDEEAEQVASSEETDLSDVEMETLVSAFSGVLNSQMEVIQQMQIQNQQFMMSQSLQGMGPVDTSHYGAGGYGSFSIGGYGYPTHSLSPLSYSALPGPYSDFVHSPQYSMLGYPTAGPVIFQHGIPSTVGIGLGRSPAIIQQSPIVEPAGVIRAPSQAPLFNQAPQHFR